MIKTLDLLITLSLIFGAGSALAASYGRSGSAKKTVTPTKVVKHEESVEYSDGSRRSKHLGPWDFSSTIGLDNPGIEIEFLGAYRVSDYILDDLDDSLSIEAGLGFLTVTDTNNGNSYTYSPIAIPIMARWDIHIRDSKFTLAPRAGFTYLSGGTVNVGGVNFTTRGNNLYFQLGGVGFYELNENFSLRAGIAIGGFTSLNVGLTYLL
jgi:hypothetical protein